MQIQNSPIVSSDNPFIQKSIFQLQKIIRRGMRAIREANKLRFEPDTEAAAQRRARRSIKAENASRILTAALPVLFTRLAKPLRDARPLKVQRKLGLIPSVS